MQQPNVARGFTTDGCGATIGNVDASRLQLVFLEWYRRRLASLGREETARRLGCSVQMVDYLKRGIPGRAFGVGHAAQLAASLGINVQGFLGELAGIANEVDFHGLEIKVESQAVTKEEPKLRGRALRNAMKRVSERSLKTRPLREEEDQQDGGQVRQPRRRQAPHAGKPSSDEK